MKPKIIVLCGSSRFVDVMAVCGWLLERDEKAIVMGLHLLPIWYGDVPDHIAEVEGVAADMDELHLRKIDIADEIFVVDYEEYIGSSTAKEIEYAKQKSVPIRYYSRESIRSTIHDLMTKYLEANRKDIEEDM